MAYKWKIIEDFNSDNIEGYLEELKLKKYVLSEWIVDVFKNYQSKIKKDEFPITLYRIFVKDLNIHKPTTLENIYKELIIKDFQLVQPELVLITRLMYNEQKTGEWLRFATPFNSLIDSDGVPHLPKLGKALNKFFIETYWSYPEAIFHPHNEFVVRKSDK
jgi:hypothetical protein